MFRFRPSLLNARRHGATIVALLLAAQLALFAHAIGHDYARDVDQSHVVCGLCIAAQHLDHGLASAVIELASIALALPASAHVSLPDTTTGRAFFQARAPPLHLPS